MKTKIPRAGTQARFMIDLIIKSGEEGLTRKEIMTKVFQRRYKNYQYDAVEHRGFKASYFTESMYQYGIIPKLCTKKPGTHKWVFRSAPSVDKKPNVIKEERLFPVVEEVIEVRREVEGTSKNLEVSLEKISEDVKRLALSYVQNHNEEINTLKSTIESILDTIAWQITDARRLVDSFKKDKLTINTIEAEGALRGMLIIKNQLEGFLPDEYKKMLNRE
jgi:hypothetical protein